MRVAIAVVARGLIDIIRREQLDRDWDHGFLSGNLWHSEPVRKKTSQITGCIVGRSNGAQWGSTRAEAFQYQH